MTWRSEYHLGDGLVAREWELTLGKVMETHTHNFGHLTDIHYGAVRASCWRLVGDEWVAVALGDKETLEAGKRHGSSLWVPKDCRHTFEALTPLVFGKCLFLSRDPATGKPVDYYSGGEAYR